MDPRDLYGLPLDRFTEERNALAKQLRKEGRRDEAGKVAKLAKPSVAAWAVNQLVRTQRRDVDALFEAGDALQEAQADLLAKRGDPGSLRKAVESERAAVDHLSHKARGLLSSEGHELTPARIEQVSETLHAAALDQDTRARVREGELVRELRHVGLGELTGGASATRRSTKASSRSRKTAEDAKPRSARLRTARKNEADARRQLERATREAEAAEERRRRAQSALREADEALVAARQASKEAAQTHRRARRVLQELT
ncbi:MAG: hypothetical protein ACJ764_13070 [Solirubrobacteraceae bacterium]